MCILGMNSGTSADGLDLAVIACSQSGARTAYRSLAGAVVPYPPTISKLVRALTEAPEVPLDDVIACDNLLGQFYGQTAKRYSGALRRRGIQVDAIASHGQTVRHMPRKRRYGSHSVNGTLQLGSLEQVASATGKIVTGDFRQADVALGHEGAPITVAAMARLFSHPKESRLILNIGGMSNYFYFPKPGRAARIDAADCGPGNSLSDLLMQRLYRLPFDRGGKRAQLGAISPVLLKQLRALPFFRGRERSTGREQFGAQLVDSIVEAGKKLRLSPADLVATGGELTAVTVSAALRPLLKRDRSLGKLYLTGGGIRNDYITRRIAFHLPEVTIDSVQSLGYDPDLVEASAYAVMGHACICSKPSRTRFQPGREQTRFPVLGKIVQPPQGLTT